MKRARLMRKRRKFCRCGLPGHGDCIVTREIQRPMQRADDKRDYERDLAEYEKEMQDTYLGEPV